MISSITVVGKLGADAVLRPGEKSFVSLSVASDERKDVTTWVNVTYSSYAGDKIFPYLKKGTIVFVEGKPYVSSYTKDGEVIPTFNIHASMIRLVSSPKDNISTQNG